MSARPHAADLAALGPRFDWDFGRIRVHAAGAPGDAALASAAQPYTHDAAIHLGPGFERAAAPLRGRMLAHEMAHVVQQSGGTRGATTSQASVREAEAEARAAAEAALGGRPVPPLSAVSPALRLGWDSFEHVAIGDAGEPAGRRIVLDAQKKDLPNYRRPTTEWPKPWQDLFAAGTPDQKRAMQQGLTYGEVLALAGDFYGGSGPSESTEATAAFQRLNAASFMEIIRLIPLIRSSKTTTGQAETATGGRFLTLAKRNLAHFSKAGVDAKGRARNNLGVWREGHTQALLAAQSGDADTAWAMNAVADHFLTDAFSSGHTREDREKLLDSPVKAKAIHDLDNDYGVDVANRRGDRWTAYGDDNWNSKNNARNRELTFEAEKRSKADIAAAIAGGANYVVPKTFAAEELVPTPVDANKARWGTWAKIKEYAHLAVSELPGIVASTWTDDNDVRSWVASNPPAALARAPLAERERMVGVLLSGIVTDADVNAIEKILAQSPELAAFRARFASDVNSVHNRGYRTRVRSAMGF